MSEKTTPLSITYHNLNYQVEIPNSGFCKGTSPKHVLHNLNGHFPHGIHAIMGPTGCGKTTLLDSLCGRKDPVGLSGTILIGNSRQPKNFRQVCGYVAQDDVIMATLTVRENLAFSIDCRTNYNEQEKKTIIDQTLKELGLTDVADKMVGNHITRGVSGGERKRCAIGMELVVKPSIIFLDEPTTGLDATTAFQVIEILQKLAVSTKRVIIMSIHQPRYSIYKLFDSITLLALGRTSFQGTPDEAFDFFKKHNYECPKHYNPADHFLDVINGDSTAVGANDQGNKQKQLEGQKDKAGPQSQGQGQTNDGYESDVVVSTNSQSPDSHLGKSNSPTSLSALHSKEKENKNNTPGPSAGKFGKKKTRSTTKRSGSFFAHQIDWDAEAQEKNQSSVAERFNNFFLEDELHTKVIRTVNNFVETADDTKGKIKISESQETSSFRQFKVLGLRNLKNLKRNPAGLMANCIVNVIFSVVVGIMFLQVVDEGVEACQNRIGVLFFLATNIMFSAQEVGSLFSQERVLYIREICSGYYKPLPYFVSKVLLDFWGGEFFTSTEN